MGSDQCPSPSPPPPPPRRHYDLAMSRRTRRVAMTTSLPEGNSIDNDIRFPIKEKVASEDLLKGEEEEEDDEEAVGDKRNCLKELMNGGGGVQGAKNINAGSESKNHGINSLENCFKEEEKNLPLVAKRAEYPERVKLKGMVSKYMKVLNRLIKLKRESQLRSQRNNGLALPGK